VRKSQKLLEE